MKKDFDLKGLIGTYSYVVLASANNITSGILAYIMVSYANYPKSQVSMLISLPYIMGTLVTFVIAKMISSIGLKKMALISQITCFASGMVYLFLGQCGYIWILYLAASLFGFFSGCFGVISAQLYKICIPDDKKRATFLGIGTAIQSGGGVLLTTFGGMIAAKNNGANWNKAYILYFLMLIFLLIEYLCLPAVGPQNLTKNKMITKEKLPLKVYLIAIHYLIYFLCLFSFSLNISEYVITTHKLGTSVQSGFALSCMTVGGIISGLGFGYYEKLLKDKTMPVLLAIAAFSLAIMVFVPNLYALYFASVLLGLPLLGCNPYVQLELSRITQAEQYSKAMAIFSGCSQAGMMVAVYILAFLANLFFHDPNSVDGKFIIALIGQIFVVITSIPLYRNKGSV